LPRIWKTFVRVIDIPHHKIRTETSGQTLKLLDGRDSATLRGHDLSVFPQWLQQRMPQWKKILVFKWTQRGKTSLCFTMCHSHLVPPRHIRQAKASYKAGAKCTSIPQTTSKGGWRNKWDKLSVPWVIAESWRFPEWCDETSPIHSSSGTLRSL